MQYLSSSGRQGVAWKRVFVRQPNAFALPFAEPAAGYTFLETSVRQDQDDGEEARPAVFLFLRRMTQRSGTPTTWPQWA